MFFFFEDDMARISHVFNSVELHLMVAMFSLCIQKSMRQGTDDKIDKSALVILQKNSCFFLIECLPCLQTI